MRASLRVAIGFATAVSLAFGTSVAAYAEPVDLPELGQELVTGDIGFEVSGPDALPVVESEISRGAALSTVSGSRIPLGEIALGATSALVRIAVLSPAADTTVFRSGGVPVLETPGGVSASTAVLLPVDPDSGTAEIWADHAAQVRIEVLSSFTGAENLPGSMLALTEPVLRADTANGLAGTALNSAPITVGLVGQGGVPSERVRSAWVTVRVELDAAGILELGAQRVPLPAGATTFTTVIAPDENGAALARLEGASGQLRLHVIGWVPEAPAQGSQLSLERSFVPTSRLDELYGQSISADPEGPTRDDFETVARNTDAIYSLALVTLSAATETTLFDFGPAYEGRAKGAVVDRQGGAAPQLMLVPSTPDGDGFTLRRGGARLDWLPVGDYLGAERTRPAADLAIDIDTHRDGDEIDLGSHGYFSLGGVIANTEATSSIDRVEVSGPEGLIGTADVGMERGELRWSFDAAAPHDGTFTYTAEVFDRSGNSRSTDIDLVVEALDEDDTVIAPDLWLLNDVPGETEARLVPEEPDTVYVTALVPLKPGDALIADASEDMPEGLFVEVESFDRVGAEWRVRTTKASFEDVFFQVSVEESELLDDELFGSDIDDELHEASITVEDDEGVEIPGEIERLPGDAGYEIAEVVSGPDVDVDPLVCEYPLAPDVLAPEECADVDGDGILPIARSAPSAPTSLPAAVRPAAALEISHTLGINVNVTLLSGERTLSQSPKFKDLSKSAENPEEFLQQEFREMTRKDEAGITLSLAAQFSPKLEFVLETHITWKWGFIPTGVVIDKFKIQFTVTSKGKVSLQAYYKFQQTVKAYNKIAAFSLPTITIPVGPVPIVIFNEIELALQTQLKLQATLTASLSYTEVDVWGTEYSGSTGQWKSLDEPTKTTHSPLTMNPLEHIELKFAGELSSGPVATAKSKIFGLAGPELSISAGIGIAGTLIFNATEGYAQLSIFARLTAGAKVKFELFSFKSEAEIWGTEWKFEFWKGRHYFYKNPPPAGYRSDLSPHSGIPIPADSGPPGPNGRLLPV